MIVLNTTDKLQIKTSGSTITSMTIVVSYAVPQATTLSLSRDGAWTRQRAGFVNAGAAAVTENVF